MALNYSPIVLDSINYNSFPDVALYVKSDNAYTLYKPPEIKITTHNIERLRENGTEFLYINTEDSEVVQAHIEENFDAVYSNKAVPQLSKNLIFGQIMIKCISDVFKNPTMTVAYHKCSIILKQFSMKFEDRDELVKFLKKLELTFEKYLITHTAQVTILSMYLYEKLFSGNKLVDVGFGAMLHDIGMLYIAGNITEKRDALSEDEYHRVKLHPKHGVDLLTNAGITDKVVLDIARSHHERHDGSGYPAGLHDRLIPDLAMLVSICDIYCALTMDRPYRSASSPEEALETLNSERNIFAPDIFDGFIRNMARLPAPTPST